MAINITSLNTSGQTDQTTSTPQVYTGGSLTFTVVATATQPGGSTAAISYLWQVSSNGGVTWFDLPNNGLSSITVTNWSITQNGSVIRVQLSANSGPGGSLETILSNEVGFPKTVTVLQQPTIVITDYNNPSYIVSTGGSVTLRVDATISSTLSQFANTNSANIDTELVMTWQYSTDNGNTWLTHTSTSNALVTTTLSAYGTSPETYYKQSQLQFTNIGFSINNYRYRCLVSYTKDAVTAQNSPLPSDSSTITVNPQILITKQPGVSPDTTSAVVSYNASITGSGRATFSVVAFSTASSSITYRWQYTLDEGISYLDVPLNNPIFSGGEQVLFQLLTGTSSISPILELDRLVIRNGGTSRYGFRVTISGSAGETQLISDTAFVTITQSATGLFEDPVDQFVIEDKYGNISDRSNYPEFIQTATFSASVDLNAPNGLQGSPITLQWQRKDPGATTFNDVGVAKITSGSSATSGGSLNPNNPGVYDYTTPPVRRDVDHQAQYRLACTYPTGNGVFTTSYSSAATLNVYRTAYIDSPPVSTNVYVNAPATFAVLATPSSGSTISYQWQESSNNSNWFNISNSVPLSVSSITRNNYIATVTCASAHGFVAGDRIYIEGSTSTEYNGSFVVLSSGLTTTAFQYRTYSIPLVSPAPGTITVTKSPKYTGATTAALNINPVVGSIIRRYFRCVITVPDSLSTTTTESSLLGFLNDTFYQINSLNDLTVFQYNSAQWTVTANSLSLRAPYYQWQYNPTSNAITSTGWTDIVGANSSTLTVTNVQPSNAGFYRCKVTSAGEVVSQSNAARLRVTPVSIAITTNIPNSITILENNTTTVFRVAATASTGTIPTYQWQIKGPSDSTFSTAPPGFGQTSSTFQVYNLNPFSRTVNNGSVLRCAISTPDVPGIVYTNECTITVDRRFYYFADAATKTVPAGQEVTFDITPTYTGDDDPTYQWQRRINSSSAWNNIPGETNPSYTILATNVTPAISNSQYRCIVTLNQVTTFQYNRNLTNIIQPISPAGTPTPTQEITLVVSNAVPNIPYYSKQRQKVGAAIGTVICVPKPAGYVYDASANTDDIVSWRVAVTGQTLAGTPAAGVSSSTAPYGPNDRFPGFIEMRGQIVKARDFPELARILGTTYGGSITGTYPTYNANDTFRLPCPYAMKLMGLGNVDNNRSSPSVIPVHAPNSTSGGSITEAGSMGGEYNFEKLPQLPPGSPGEGTGDGTSSDTFTIGVHRTEGWENCQNTVSTTFRGNFTWQVGGDGGVTPRSFSSPTHTHTINSIAYNNNPRGNGGGGNAARINYDEGGNVFDGPAFVSPRGRSHQHGLGFEAGNVVYTPPSGGGSGGGTGESSFSNPGGTFTLPSNVTGFTYSITAGAGGGGGRDTNQGAPGGSGASASGTITNIPAGSTIGIKVGNGGGGGSGCGSNSTGGTGGNSGGTGFGGGQGGSSGSNGCSGSGGGGGGATFIYIDTLGSGSNPAGLAKGDILVIVGGGGGGGGGGHHGGSQSTIYPGADAAGSWASSSITSSQFYTNQSSLSFTPYNGNGTVLQSGRTGQNRNDAGGSRDGGGGGGGGGGYRGGTGGTARTGCTNGDCNANGGSGGQSAYKSSVHSGTPTISVGGTQGGAQATSGTSGSASISYAGATTVTPTNPGGISSADHGEGIGTVGSTSLTQTVDIHNDTSSSNPSMGVDITDGDAKMSTRSRTAWDSAHTFYLRNNEVLPMIQPYFRLKYMIKAF